MKKFNEELLNTRRRDGLKELDLTYVQVDKTAWRNLKIKAIKENITYRVALKKAIEHYISAVNIKT